LKKQASTLSQSWVGISATLRYNASQGNLGGWHQGMQRKGEKKRENKKGSPVANSIRKLA
jgi:hypothetical protein